jgi:hypothetical protein
VQTEATAEAAHVVNAALVLGAGDVPLHKLDRLVTGRNIYAGSGVALGFGVRVHDIDSFQYKIQIV